MEVYLKKYFWVVPVIVVITCSVFTAKAVNHYVEGEFLGDAEAAPAVPTARAPRKAPERRSKSGETLAKRNMFCSECEPPEPEEQVGEVVDSDHPPLTSLPLRLVATNVSTLEKYSFATIQNTSSDRQGAYSIEQVIPDAGAVVRISSKFVDFENEKTRRVERLALLDTSAPKARPTPAPTRKPTTRSGGNDLMSMIDDGVNKVDDSNYEIDRKVVDKVLENPAAVARGARIVPSIKNGKANGFKLYAIRPSSVYAKIGLMNGDTIHSINGFELTSPDKALEVYMKLREANSLSVNATRRGKPVTLNYNIK